MSEYNYDDLHEQIVQVNERLEPLMREKIERESEEVRQSSEHELKANWKSLEANIRWFRQTDDGWVLVKRDDTAAIVSLPSHLKVSLTSTAGGRDNITVLEGLWTGLKANLTTGFLVTTNPQHGSVTAEFKTRVGGPIVIGGVTFDKQILLTFERTGAPITVGPHPAKTDPTNPVATGTHVLQIPDFPHALGSIYGPLGTVWFRIGTSGDRYIHPGRESAGCITCAPSTWAEIYSALARGRKDSTSVGDVKVL
jgi:hypothetical protein